MKKMFPFPLVLLFIAGCFSRTIIASPMDLSKIQCDFPWETFTTDSNTAGILFEDQGKTENPYFLTMTNARPGNVSVEMKFSMKTLLESDRISSVGLQFWEGLETYGKDKSLKGHFLVLYNSDGNLDVKRWNGSYYATIMHKTRFSLTPDKPQVLKVELSKAGSIKVYIKNRLQMAVRVKVKPNIETPIRICGLPGTWMEMTSFEVK